MPFIRTHPDTETARARLRAILLERSVRFGDFVLASGDRSRYYVDVRQTSLDPEGSVLIARLLSPILDEAGIEAVGGLTMGADPIVSACVTWSGLHGTSRTGFLVRREVKAHGTGRRIEGPFREGLVVAIVDDVITKGGSSLAAYNAARDAGAEVRLVACVVDRGEGGAEEFAALGVPFRALFHIQEFLT